MKFKIILTIILCFCVAFSFCSCALSVSAKNYEAEIAIINDAYLSMVENNNLCAQFLVYNEDNSRTANVYFGNLSTIIYGVDTYTNLNDAVTKSFYCENNFWYLNDGKQKIVIKSENLTESLWQLDMEVLFPKDIIHCIKPTSVFNNETNPQKYPLSKTPMPNGFCYEATIMSSFALLPLIVNPTDIQGKLYNFEGNISYYIIGNSVDKIVLEINYTYKNELNLYHYKSIINLTTISKIPQLNATEKALYKL
ncbi:MAG: hypothetical protein RR054_01115 [Clostridia bacterium]